MNTLKIYEGDLIWVGGWLEADYLKGYEEVGVCREGESKDKDICLGIYGIDEVKAIFNSFVNMSEDAKYWLAEIYIDCYTKAFYLKPIKSLT